MSKWHVFIALALIFNVLVRMGFVLECIDIIGCINSVELTAVFSNLFSIEIVHPVIIDGTIVYPSTSLANVIPNYPFILFWVAIIGNLGFIALALVLRNRESKLRP